MDELGLHQYGDPGISTTKTKAHTVVTHRYISNDDICVHNDEGSLRITAMQEDEILHDVSTIVMHRKIHNHALHQKK